MLFYPLRFWSLRLLVLISTIYFHLLFSSRGLSIWYLISYNWISLVGKAFFLHLETMLCHECLLNLTWVHRIVYVLRDGILLFRHLNLLLYLRQRLRLLKWFFYFLLYELVSSSETFIFGCRLI